MSEVMDLQLFAEGGAAGGDGGTSAPAGNEGGENAPASAPVFKSKRAGKANPYAGVVFGKQGQTTPGAPQSNGGEGSAKETGKGTKAEAPADRNAVFEEMIAGEYKDLFEARIADARKQGETPFKGDADRYKQMAGMLEVLGRKHGISPDSDGNLDLSKLSKAVEAEDKDYWEKLSLETGRGEEELREEHRRNQMMKALQEENARYRREEQERKGREQARRIFAGWEDQAKQAQSVYPSLDLRKELKNKDFAQLLQAGVNVKTAFEVIHKDEIVPAAMQYAAKKVENNMAGKIAAQAARPVENGSGGSPVQVKTDVSKLTKAERREIARRVSMGERIVF